MYNLEFCRNFFRQITKSNLVKISSTAAELLQVKHFQYGGVDLELWPWPLKSWQWELTQTLNITVRDDVMSVCAAYNDSRSCYESAGASQLIRDFFSTPSNDCPWVLSVTDVGYGEMDIDGQIQSQLSTITKFLHVAYCSFYMCFFILNVCMASS